MINFKHLEILKQGTNVWNKWRHTKFNKFKYIDLSGTDLSGIDFTKIYLTMAYLKATKFKRAILIKADLRGSNLSKADFSEANLDGADLRGSNLSEADFSGANLDGADLRGSNLSEANFSEANLDGAKLKGAKIKNTQFKNAKNLPDWINKGLFENCIFSKHQLIISIKNGLKNLIEANLSGAILNKADLNEADLSKANLIFAKLRGADLNKANLSEADLKYADLSEADLNEADLSKANLIFAKLRGADLNKANLSEADLKDANLSEAKVTEIDLSETDLRRAVLEKTSFKKSKSIPEWIKKGLDERGIYEQKYLIENIRLGFKNLNGANLSNADLKDVNLEGAYFANANFGDADLKDANLEGAHFGNANNIPAWIEGGLDKKRIYSQNYLIENIRHGFINCLRGANLSGANLRSVNISNADLRGANLSGADLRESVLSGVLIEGTNFKNSNNLPEWINKGLNEKGLYSQYELIINIKRGFKNLSGANLKGADFWGTDLTEVYLAEVDLEGANFANANIPEWIKKGLDKRGIYSQQYLIKNIRRGFKNLSGANLSGVEFNNSDLIGADIEKTNFKNSKNLPEWVKKGLDGKLTYSQQDLIKNIKLGFKNLSGANLSGSDIRGADMKKADLRNAELSWIDLSGVDLNEANLSGTILCRADLSGADLSGAKLSAANLRGASLISTNLTKANITGSNLYGSSKDDWVIDGIECDYFYNDPNGKTRIPIDKKFKKKEFEEKYKQFPSFDYIFENGFTPIDAFIMDQIVQAINEQQPEIELKLDSFHSRGQPRAVFTVLHKHDVEETQKQIVYEYEKRIIALEGKNEVLKELVLSSMNKPQQHIERLITMGDNINITSQGNAAFGKDNATVNQTNIEHAANNELLTEIKKLKEELSKLNIDQANREAIDIQFDTLEIYANKSDKKNPVLMKSTLDSIKAITQGALGSAIGSGLVETFNRIGSMIL